MAVCPLCPLFFFFFFILTLFDGAGDQENLHVGREACIAQRGVDRSGLSFGADPDAIFDVFHFFIVVGIWYLGMKKKSDLG